MKLVLMCGGVGKKMWPQSRKSSPKHFLPLFEGSSLFELTYNTLRKRFSKDDIYLQTNLEQSLIARKLCSEIHEDHCFIEPEIRDHGPATGLLAINLLKQFPKETFINIQTDVIRQPVDNYLDFLEAIDQLVQKEGRLVTGGMKTKYPVMGVDYLKVDPATIKIGGNNAYRMVEWLGRDTKESVITDYINQSSVLLHANSYAWTPEAMLQAYKTYAPEWYLHLMEIGNSLGKREEKTVITREYSLMEKGPVENVTKHVLNEGYVVENSFEWIDFGSWSSVARYQKENNTYKPENVIEVDSKENYVVVPRNKQVAIIGLNNVTIVDTQDGLLVCSNDSTGKVGEVVEKLKEQGKEQYL